MLEKTIDVVQMGEHFLYLPLYYAIDRGFFGYLQRPDVEYRFSHPRSVHPATDEAVFATLAKSSADKNNVLFAIGDPRSLVSHPNWAASPVALIGALVTGTAFWAIDHGRKETQTVHDLCRFREIVSFKRGSTSYDLAASIVGGSQSTRIVEVDPTQELDYLVRSAQEDVVVLSPDMLGISRLVGPHTKFDIELSIGSQYAYCDLLITAVATTRDAVHDDPFLVRGVLKGLQRALQEIHARSGELVEYAAQRFASRDAIVTGALKFAEKSRVYPYSVRLNEALWMRAFTGPLRTMGNTSSPDEIRQALNVYQLVGAPYEQYASAALTDLLIPVSAPVVSPPPMIARVDYVGLVPFTAFLVFSGWLGRGAQFAGVAIFALACMLFLTGQWLARRHLTGNRNARLAYWSFYSVVMLVASFQALRYGNETITTKELLLSVPVPLGLSAVLFVVATIARRQPAAAK